MDVEFNHQKIINRKIESPKIIFSKEKKSVKSNSSSIKTNGSLLDSVKTKENSAKFNEKENFFPNEEEEDIDYLKKFEIEKKNIPYIFNNRRKIDINTSEVSNFSSIKNTSSIKNIKKETSGKIPHPKKSHGNIPIDKKSFKKKFVKNNIKIEIGEKKDIKRPKIKYNSATEKKYRKKIKDNKKMDNIILTESITPKKNYASIETNKIKRCLSHTNQSNNMKNMKQNKGGYLNSKYNTINNSYSNLNSNQNTIENIYYINQTENINDKQYDEINNKKFKKNLKSSFNYNTVKGSILQNNIKSTRIDQKNEYKCRNILTFNNILQRRKSGEKSNQIKKSKSFSKITFNPQTYLNTQNISNLKNNDFINNNKNIINNSLITTENNNINDIYHNIAPYNKIYTPKQIGVQKEIIFYDQSPTNNNIKNKEVKYATVQKIFSSKIENSINNSLKENKNPNNYETNINFEQLTNQINKSSYNQINNSQVKQKQIINNNNYLSQQDLNKSVSRNPNLSIKQKTNNIFSHRTLTITLPKEKKKLSNSIKTNANKVINTNSNLNSKNKNQIKNLNLEENLRGYNQPESDLEKTIDENDKTLQINERKTFLNNSVDLIYDDFDASGFIKNYNGVSLPGKDFTGNTKTNQDTFIFKANINKVKDFNIFGVLDGHGPDGHFISKFASDYIPSQIINHPEIKNLSSPEEIYNKLKEHNCKIINEAFASTDNQLKNMKFDIAESGCTCCLVIHIGVHILCANIGDSRAIVVYNQSNNINDIKSNNLDYLGTAPLSIDYKPDCPEEKKRILKAGGVIEKMKDEKGEEIGPYRVWIKGKDYPGLAISRSIGDLEGKIVGIISEPGIMEYDLNISTKYIIVCSDGVWDFLNNETVMNIGKQFYLENNAAKFCHELVSRAFKEWKKNEIMVDDITAVVAFF